MYNYHMQEVDKTANIEPVGNSRGLILHRIFQLVLSLVLVLIVANSITSPIGAFLDNRSVTSGSSIPDANTYNTFTFDILGTPTIGSIAFEYCSNSPLPTMSCTAPSGFDSSAVTLASQSGITDFSIHPDTTLTPNKIILTRTPGVVGAGTVSYRFDNITNPDATNTTVYVRLATYSSTDASGVYDDSGAVTFSIQSPLTITLYVPPFLALCTGVTVASDCASASGTTVDLGELSKTSANSGTTQFAVATNSINGYVASIQGNTMTAGNQTITALPVQTGVNQFGINLRANSSPGVGHDIEGSGAGVVATNYNTPNQFKFVDGDVLATAPLPSAWNRYTISYLVNVDPNQHAGRYATTMTVIATTTF